MKKKTANVVLVLMAIFILIFVISMTFIFCIKGSVPDTLIVAVFGACTGEASILGWIKTIKTKNGGKSNEEKID